MTRVRRLMLLPAAALLLSGCVAGLVAGTVGIAADSGRGSRERNEAFMQAAARQACTAHAAQYGAVQVSGLRQLEDGEIVVSGTVTDASGKNMFECSFVTEITGFALRRAPPET